VANHSSATTQAATEPTTQIMSSGGANEHHPQASAGARTRITNPVRRETVVAANAELGQLKLDQPQPDQPKLDQPKLDQFPSPRPLTEQEKILQSYVAENPEKAVLIARARSEALQRDLEEMKAFASGEWASNSDDHHDTTER
jgi:hypothetical protein